MKNKKIISLVIILSVIVGVFALLNRNIVKDKKEVHAKSEVSIKGDGQTVLLKATDIKQIGQEEFAADLKSSGKSAEEHIYTGVPVKALLRK